MAGRKLNMTLEHEPLNPWDVDTLRYPARPYSTNPLPGPTGSTEPGSSRPAATWKYPMMAKIWEGKKPNQHGHPLLCAYQPTTEATGMGYGTLHKDYYRYISHYKVNLDGMAPVKEEVYMSKRGPGFGPNADAGGLGYGTGHSAFPWYVSVKTSYDLPPPSFAPLPTIQRKR